MYPLTRVRTVKRLQSYNTRPIRNNDRYPTRRYYIRLMSLEIGARTARARVRGKRTRTMWAYYGQAPLTLRGDDVDSGEAAAEHGKI